MAENAFSPDWPSTDNVLAPSDDASAWDKFKAFLADDSRPVGPGIGRALDDVLRRALTNAMNFAENPQMPGPESAANFATPLGGVAGVIKGFHGTPYRFAPVEHNPFGEFRDSAIGSGEGAQAYGYGHYVAGKQGVAEYYKDALSDRIGGNWTLDEVPLLDSAHTVHILSDEISPDAFEALRPNLAESHAATKSNLESASSWEPADSPTYDPEEIDPLKEALSWWKSNEHRLKYNGPESSLYSVEMNVEPEDLLDWDKHFGGKEYGGQDFNEQLIDLLGEDTKPSDILKGRSLRDQQDFPVWKDDPKGWMGIEGSHLYHYLSNQLGGEAAASAALARAGIPGIKYLDQGSRDINSAHGGVLYKGENITGPLQLPQNSWRKMKELGLDETADSAIDILHRHGDVNKTLNELYSALAKREARYGSDSKFTQDTQSTLDWLENNKQHVGFAPPIEGTYNYVIFDPKNLKITARNGVPLTPVEHDPFSTEGPEK